MKTLLFFIVFLLNSIAIFSQNLDNSNNPVEIVTENFVGVDNFSALYTIDRNILYKNWNKQTWQFGDYSLGSLTQVSITNPLKILLFYENLNTVVILDKYLNEISRINFNTTIHFKSPAFVSQANDQSIWLFDNNTQQLEIFDLETEETLFTTLPFKGIPVDQSCNFNYCWLLTDNKILQFNIYGNLLTELPNENFNRIHLYKKGILLKKENKLFYWSSQKNQFDALELPKIMIEDFYVTGEKLYIYSAGTLYSYNLPQLIN